MDSSRIHSGLFLAGKVEEHLLMVQKQAEQRLDVLVEQMAAEGVTERLRAADQMLWVRKVNGIRERGRLWGKKVYTLD